MNEDDKLLNGFADVLSDGEEKVDPKEVVKLKAKLEKNEKVIEILKEDAKINEESITTCIVSIKELKLENDNLKNDLRIYSTNYLNDKRSGYKIYVLDPFYKESVLNDIKKLKKQTNIKFMEKLFLMLREKFKNEDCPEILVVNDKNYEYIIEYFIEIDQDYANLDLILSNEFRIKIYISETLADKTIILK